MNPELVERLLKLFDELDKMAAEAKKEPTEAILIEEEEFDFLSIAEKRLSDRFGKSNPIQIREIYRICGAYFSFDKQTTRAMLKSLKKRGKINYGSETVVHGNILTLFHSM
jgi:predicted acyltransferase (DUF342 family)